MSIRRSYNIRSIAIIAIVFGFFYALKSQFPHYRVNAQNMYPHLVLKDVILTSKFIDNEGLGHHDICIVNHKKELYATRIVGLPGDKIEIKDGILFVNDQEEATINEATNYKVKLRDYPNLAKYELLFLLKPLDQFGAYEAILTKSQAAEIANYDCVSAIQKIIHPKGYRYIFSDHPIYPNRSSVNWSRDNFGPITIPKKGDEIGRQHKVLQNNYYFVLGDNRHQSLDSRHWGLVSEMTIEGKMIAKLYTNKE